MRQKVNVLRHIGVLLLTNIIFFLGLFIGNTVEEMRVEVLYSQLQDQDLDYQKMLVESQYIDYLIDTKTQNNVTCDTISGAYFTSIENLGDSTIKLEQYLNNANSNEEDYQRLKDYYSNVQVTYWLLAQKIENLCQANMNTILFFYGDKKKCPSCEDQGVHLTYVKQKLKDDVLVFSFDAEKQGAIKLISQNYQIQGRELPSLIINGELHSFMSNEQIFEVLCGLGLDSEVCLK
ncbi:MAG: hypothetical protein HRU03_04035 [Nanoarchaeales archaeon]|nr:hypothetical protein [Nanoarchaeales archaeon]